MAADVWEKDVWEFQAKSGSSGSCCLFLYVLGKIAVQEMSGRTPGSRRHPSSRHPRPSDEQVRKRAQKSKAQRAKECKRARLSAQKSAKECFCLKNRRFRKGVGGRGLATNKPSKKSTKVLQKCVPILLRGHRKKGTEKRPKSLGFEGFLRANPLCPPTPFRNF